MSAEVLGDVTAIQDEDLLRKLWQQTDDFGKKKEIRAHMYKLREARLRDFYTSGDLTETQRSVSSSEIHREGISKVSPFPSMAAGLTGSQCDSFADQSFQSLKSKEIRDSESPPRGYGGYKVSSHDVTDDAKNWTVVSNTYTSDDGKTQGESKIATAANIRDVDGGKASFAALQEQHKIERNEGDANNYVKSSGKTSKTVSEENFTGGDDNCSIQASKTSSTSLTSKVVSQKYSSNFDDDDVRNSAVPQERSNYEMGETVSRRVDYPDANTKLITETRTLADGSTVTSKRYESVNQTSQQNVQRCSETNQQSTKNESVSRNQGGTNVETGETISCSVEYPDAHTKVTTEVRTLPDGSKVTSKKYESSQDSRSHSIHRDVNETTSKRQTSPQRSTRPDSKSSETVSRSVTYPDADTKVTTETRTLADGSTITSKKYESTRQSESLSSLTNRELNQNVNKNEANVITRGKQIQQDGETVSRSVEYPDANTKVTTEVRTLPDGSTITSKKYESSKETQSKVSNAEVSQTTNKRDASPRLSKETVTRTVEYPDDNTKLVIEKRVLADGTTVTSKKYETIRDSKNISRNVSNSTTVDKSSRRTDVYDDTTEINRSSSERSPHREPQKPLSDKIVTVVDTDDTSRNVLNKRTTNTEFINIERNIGASTTDHHDKVTKHDYENITKQQFIGSKPAYEKEPQKKQDKEPKPTPSYDEESHSKVPPARDVPPGEYTTTYQTEFIPKKISVDLSPSHNAFASSLRSDGVFTPEKNTPRSSTRTSTSSLRSSVSPDKIPKHTDRRSSPSKDVTTIKTEKRDQVTRTVDSRNTKISPDFPRASPVREPTSSKKECSSPTRDRSSPTKSPVREKPISERPKSPEKKAQKPYGTSSPNKSPVRERPSDYVPAGIESHRQKPLERSPSPEKKSQIPTVRDTSDKPSSNLPNCDFPQTRPQYSEKHTQSSKSPEEKPNVQDNKLVRKPNESRSSPKKEIHKPNDKSGPYSSGRPHSPEKTKPRDTSLSTHPSERSPSPEKVPKPNNKAPLSPSKSPTSQRPVYVDDAPVPHGKSSVTDRTVVNRSTVINETVTTTKKPSTGILKHDEEPKQHKSNVPEKSRSGDSSPTSSTSDIEFLRPSNSNPHLVTDLDIDDNMSVTITVENVDEKSDVQTLVSISDRMQTINTDTFTRKKKVTEKDESQQPSATKEPASPNRPSSLDLLTQSTDEHLPLSPTKKNSIKPVNNVSKQKDTSPTKPNERIPVKQPDSPIKDKPRTTSPQKDLRRQSQPNDNNRSPTKSDVTPSRRTSSPTKEVPSRENSLPRKSSLKKTPLLESPDSTVPVSPEEATKYVTSIQEKPKHGQDKPKERPPLFRTETYEERCRKILGMPDKITLVTDAEKNITKIFKNNASEPKSSSISPSSSTPNRELSPNPKLDIESHLINLDSQIIRESSTDNTDFIQKEQVVEEICRQKFIRPTTPDCGRSRPHGHGRSPRISPEREIREPRETETLSKELKSDKINDFSVQKRTPVSSPERSPTLVSKRNTPQPSQDRISPEKQYYNEVKEPNEQTDILPSKSSPSRSSQSSPDRKSPGRVSHPSQRSSTPRESSPKRTPQTSPERNNLRPKQHQSSKVSEVKITENITSTNFKPTTQKEKPKQSIQEFPSQRRSPYTSPVRKTSKTSPIKNEKQIKKSEPHKFDTPQKVLVNSRPKSPTKPSFKDFSSPRSPDRSPEPVKHSTKSKPNEIIPKDTISKPCESSDRKHVTTAKINLSHSSIPHVEHRKVSPTTIAKQPQRNVEKPKQTTPAVSKQILNVVDRLTQKTTRTHAISGGRTTKTIDKKVSTKKKVPIDSDEYTTDDEDTEVDVIEVEPKKTRPVSTDSKVTKVVTDLKMIRSTSDNVIKTPKVIPTRNKSKPEMSITKPDSVIKSPTRNLNTARNVTSTKSVHKSSENKTPIRRRSKPDETRPAKCVTTKTITLTAKMNGTEETDQDVLVDIQLAKSSREGSPNRICPLPVRSDEDTGKPRYPDQISEPEDETLRRKPSKIRSIPIFEDGDDGFDISEIPDDNNVPRQIKRTTEITEIDKVQETDECLLSVTDKVSRFLTTADKLKDKPKDIKGPAPVVPRPELDDVDESLRTDECLLSVSDKVTKFLSTSSDKKKQKLVKSPHDDYSDDDEEIDEGLELDDCLLSVTDKVSKFLITAEQITRPLKPNERAPKVERPKFEDVDETLKTDECLLSVSDKVTKFISTAEKLTPQKSPEMVAKLLRKIPEKSRDHSPEKPSNELYESTETTDVTFCGVHELGPSARYTANLPVETIDVLDLKPSSKSNVEPKKTLQAREIFEKQSPSKNIQRSPKYPRESSPKKESPTAKNPTKHSPKEVVTVTTPRKETTTTKKDSKYEAASKKPDSSFKSPTRESGFRASIHTTEKTTSLRNAPEVYTTKDTIQTIPDSSNPAGLRSTEAVRKAKALFENISQQQTTVATTTTVTDKPRDILSRQPVSKIKKSPESRDVKLTDIGVYKRKTDDAPDLIPRQETDSYSTATPSDEDIDIEVTRREKEHITKKYIGAIDSKKTKTSSTFIRKKGLPDIHPDSKTSKSSNIVNVTKELINNEKNKSTRTNGTRETISNDKYPTRKISADRPTSPVQHLTTEGNPRSSVKFGVTLRRTDSGRTITTERRRSSTQEPHTLPIIEDIYDLELLEQMLETVVGYEQRRRIRAQIRIVRKQIESTTTTTTTTITTTESRKSGPRDTSPFKGKSPIRQLAEITKSKVENNLEVRKKTNTQRVSGTLTNLERTSKSSTTEKYRDYREVSSASPRDLSPIHACSRHHGDTSPHGSNSPDAGQYRERSTTYNDRAPQKMETHEHKHSRRTVTGITDHHWAAKTESSALKERRHDDNYARSESPEVRHSRRASFEKSEHHFAEKTTSSALKERHYGESIPQRNYSPDSRHYRSSPNGRTEPHWASKTESSALKERHHDNNYARSESPEFRNSRRTSFETSEHHFAEKTTSSALKEKHYVDNIPQRTDSPDTRHFRNALNDHHWSAKTESSALKEKHHSPHRSVSPELRHSRRSIDRSEHRWSSKTESSILKEKHHDCSSPHRSESPESRHSRRTPVDRSDHHWSTKTASSSLKEKSQLRKTTPKAKEPVDDKPSWVKSNVLRKASTEARTFKIKKPTEKTAKEVYRRTPSPNKSEVTSSITSSYGVGPTDEDGKPLFGIRALRQTKKTAPVETHTQVRGTVLRESYYSENGSEPIGEISVTRYSSDPQDLEPYIIDKAPDTHNRTPSAIRKALFEKENVRKGLTSVTTTQKLGPEFTSTNKVLDAGQSRAVLDSTVKASSAKIVRRGSVKALTDKFIKNSVETSKTEKSAYPKAGLILRSSSFKDPNGSQSRSSRESTPGETMEHITKTTEMRSSTSFLGSHTRVTDVQDILTRMRNADSVVEPGDTSEDVEARSLLNKFLGAAALLSGMESPTPAFPLKDTSDREGMSERSATKTVTTTTGRTRVGDQKENSRVTKTVSLTSQKIEDIWDEQFLRTLLEQCTSYDERRKIRARLRQVMAEQQACADIVASATSEAESCRPHQDVAGDSSASVHESSTTFTSGDGSVTTSKTVTSKTMSSPSPVGMRTGPPKPISPFAKFRQLDKQNSVGSPPSTPKSPASPGAGPMFKFTDPALARSASTVKDRLLYWAQVKTKGYENVKVDNFSTSWADGMAFCALIHHFLPEAFDFSQLSPQRRRYNFTLAFRVADEQAGIAPLLDVEDMVMMRKPDWKCVFTYVQAIYRRFKDED